ncbi:hypothetical protein BLNAU_9670 [Blattamonas nauphoetae]|uniref:Uncharacterized protein n=1 Tax=Blattamonas nauphoetae TaxID=2049346 RepID=A0ABQ9XVC5_9EUKA|nr:hypothetical protein BLNAU_9670 [Blattamonas nauphoetae]
MAFQSLLSKVESETTNQFVIWLVHNYIGTWKGNRAETWRRGRILLQTLEQEGFGNHLEQAQLPDQSSMNGYYLRYGESDSVKIEAADCFETTLRDLDWRLALWPNWTLDACLSTAANILDASIASVFALLIAEHRAMVDTPFHCTDERCGNELSHLSDPSPNSPPSCHTRLQTHLCHHSHHMHPLFLHPNERGHLIARLQRVKDTSNLVLVSAITKFELEEFGSDEWSG